MRYLGSFLAAVAVVGLVSLAQADETAATRILPAALQELGVSEGSLMSAREAQDVRGAGTMEMTRFLGQFSTALGGIMEDGAAGALDPFQYRNMTNVANRFTNMESVQNRFTNMETLGNRFTNMENIGSQFTNMESLQNQFTNVFKD